MFVRRVYDNYVLGNSGCGGFSVRVTDCRDAATG